jgi:hypothetical protein
MDDAITLLEIEAIKQLKARYCRYLTKDWAAWRGIRRRLSQRHLAGGRQGDRRR